MPTGRRDNPEPVPEPLAMVLAFDRILNAATKNPKR
jgi:hypothetical protein